MRALVSVWWPLAAILVVMLAASCGSQASASNDQTVTISVDLTDHGSAVSGARSVEAGTVGPTEVGIKRVSVKVGRRLPDPPLYVNGERWHKQRSTDQYPLADWPKRQLTVIADYGIYGADVHVTLALASRELPESVAKNLAAEVLVLLTDWYTRYPQSNDANGRANLFFGLNRGWGVEEITLWRTGTITLPPPPEPTADESDDGLNSRAQALLDFIHNWK